MRRRAWGAQEAHGLYTNLHVKVKCMRVYPNHTPINFYPNFNTIEFDYIKKK